MAKVQVRLDQRGIEQLLKSAGVRRALPADQIAAHIRQTRQGADVVVDDYTTDRAAKAVTVRDVRARGWQARDGLLTRAVSAAGLKLRDRR